MRYLLLQVRDSLQQIADADQTRMGLVAYLMTSAETQMLEVEEELEKEVKTFNHEYKISEYK